MSNKEPPSVTVPIKGELRRRVQVLAKLEKRSLGRQIELMLEMGIDEFERLFKSQQVKIEINENECKDGGSV